MPHNSRDLATWKQMKNMMEDFIITEIFKSKHIKIAENFLVPFISLKTKLRKNIGIFCLKCKGAKDWCQSKRKSQDEKYLEICIDFGDGTVRTRACWMIKDGRIRPNSPSLMTKEATIVYIYKHRTAAGREIRTGQLLWSFKAIFFAIQYWQKVIDTSHVPLSFISTEGALGLPTTKQW